MEIAQMESLDVTIEFLGSEATDGYGPSQIPSVIDDGVRSLLRAIFPDDGSVRTDIISRLVERHGFVFVAFGERMAAYAVRTTLGNFLHEGIRALSLASCLLYYKEVVPIVSLLHRAAQKIGLDAHSLFVGVPYPNNQFQSAVEGFAGRDEADRSVEAMGYVEAQDQEGFRFNRTW
jgi:hypothetical protein